MNPDITNLQNAKRRLDELNAAQRDVVDQLRRLQETQTANASLIMNAKAVYEAERDSVIKALLT